MPTPGRSRGRCPGSWTHGAAGTTGPPPSRSPWPPPSGWATGRPRRAHQRFGYASARLGNYEDAYAHLGRAEHPYRARGPGRAGATCTTRWPSCSTPGPRRARPWSRPSRRWIPTPPPTTSPAGPLALNSVGWFHAILGDHPAGAQLRRAGSRPVPRDRQRGRDGQRAGQPRVRPSAARQPRRSRRCYQQALDLHREIGGRWGVAETLGHLGDAHHAAGDLGGGPDRLGRRARDPG